MAMIRINAKLLETREYQGLKATEKVCLWELVSFGSSKLDKREARGVLRRNPDLGGLVRAGLISVGEDFIDISDAVFSRSKDAERLKRWREKNRGAEAIRAVANSTSKHKAEKISKPSDSIVSHPMEVLHLYYEILPSLSKIEKMTDDRKKKVQTTWRQMATREDGKVKSKEEVLECWREYFKIVSESDFLMGKAVSFVADFDWLINPKNEAKTIEKKMYRNSTAKKNSTQHRIRGLVL